MSDSRIVSIVRALAERVDPARVLRDVVSCALSDTDCADGVLAGAVEGRVTPLVAAGAPHTVLLDAAERAVATARPARVSDPGLGLEAVAVPVQFDSKVVAALGVAGPSAPDPRLLLPFADCAALALAARAPAPAAGGVALAELLADVGAAMGHDEVLRVALEAAEAGFGARSGLVCLLEEGVAHVARYRGVDRQRLAEAARHPDFPRLVSGDETRIVPPTDPVVGRLAAGAEFAVCLPIERGALVLLVGETPDGEGLRALEAYRRQVVAALRAAALKDELSAAHEEVARAVRVVPDPVLIVDEGGCFRAMNAAAAELFALSEPFEMGRPARGRLGHPELEALLLGDGTPTVGGRGPEGELEVALGRPEPKRWRAIARRLSPHGEAGGRLLLLRDVKKRGGGESEILTAVAGELRRGVAALREELAGAAAGDTVSDRADALEALADQLALLGDDPVVSVRPEPHDVVALVTEVVAEYRSRHPGRGLIVTARPSRIDAVVDRRLLERALHPLLDNALTYSEGAVALEVADRGEAFEVAVVDVGPGIFSGDVPGLFERFHPLDGSAPRRGLGLGLYTARRLVEAMDGRIWCDSRLGVGSRFAFRLPHVPVGAGAHTV